jgi:hypothetical protein
MKECKENAKKIEEYRGKRADKNTKNQMKSCIVCKQLEG